MEKFITNPNIKILTGFISELDYIKDGLKKQFNPEFKNGNRYLLNGLDVLQEQDFNIDELLQELKQDLEGRSNLEKEAQKRLKDFERDRENWVRPQQDINLEEEQ